MRTRSPDFNGARGPAACSSPSVTSGHPSQASPWDEARTLLNALRGYERYRAGDAGLSEAIEVFQCGAGLPESGEPDAATLTALRREVERVEAGRAETLAMVDSAVATFDAARVGQEQTLAMVDSALAALDARGPHVGRTTAALGVAANMSLAHPEWLDMHASLSRAVGGIPAARVGRGGRQLDGWVARSDNRARRIGLNAQGRLLVRTVLGHLSRSERVRGLVVQAFDTAEARYGRVDPALVLAVAARESRGRAFEDHGGRANMFRGGGTDFLSRQMEDRTLFTAAETQDWRLTSVSASNEHGAQIQPVEIPHRDQMLAYAGAIEDAQRTFEDTLRDQFGEERAAELLNDLDPTSRRMWLSLAFTAPRGRAYEGPDRTYGKQFGLRTVLGRLMARSGGEPDLSSIADPDPFLDVFHDFRRARVTAAEADLFDVALEEDASFRPHDEGVAASAPSDAPSDARDDAR